ncbi:hypothetical protein THIOM_004770 [Candidatus Thiomargarita nelsonii]|uniref:Uncharacterized protein n=1 Tax=Candidatus Thiomargarita nelsonii TaxID=1003181 RepID=A0A176RV36_9GAMM|nr:hypothetical protein THIOM_004770 [Candidatus Thiomargarita nelsonii]
MFKLSSPFFSFPRSAWECLPGRSASCKKKASSIRRYYSILSSSFVAVAPRPCLHSFERGGTRKIMDTLSAGVGKPSRTVLKTSPSVA